MARRHAYTGCDIKVGEWGTTVHGRDLRHAIKNLDDHVKEKYQLSLSEYLGQSNGNGKRIHRSPPTLFSLVRGSDRDPVFLRLTRRRRA